MAKAYFFVAADYRQAIEILQRVKDSKSVEVCYEARMLLVKACFLAGVNQDLARMLQELRDIVKTELRENGHLSKYLNGCIREVEEVIGPQPRNAQLGRSGLAEEERREFERLLAEEDDNSIIMEGMPKFLVSGRWYAAWRDFTAIEKIQREKKHPGPITQF